MVSLATARASVWRASPPICSHSWLIPPRPAHVHRQGSGRDTTSWRSPASSHPTPQKPCHAAALAAVATADSHSGASRRGSPHACAAGVRVPQPHRPGHMICNQSGHSPWHCSLALPLGGAMLSLLILRTTGSLRRPGCFIRFVGKWMCYARYTLVLSEQSDGRVCTVELPVKLQTKCAFLALWYQHCLRCIGRGIRALWRRKWRHHMVPCLRSIFEMISNENGIVIWDIIC